MLILDSGAVSQLADRSRRALALTVALREEGLWPPTVPSVVLVECLQGHAGRDASENQFLKNCEIADVVTELSLGGRLYYGIWPAVDQQSMRLSWLSRNPEARYLRPIRTT
ncbi:MAG: hypothetical protein JNK87_28660 [Bryobacterales bacterium]|nr:hypothetical protein [Bryobacterales bacterium]